MLDDYDTRIFAQFLLRPGMYVYPITRDNIISFLVGYEIGSRDRCKFTDLIGRKLEQKYHVEGSIYRWPDQIDRYASARYADWVQAFLTIATEVLNEHSTPKQRRIA